MHVATAKAILAVGEKKMSPKLWSSICDEYVKCWNQMDGRGPGIQCGRAMGYLHKEEQIGALTSDPKSPSILNLLYQLLHSLYQPLTLFY